VGSAVVPLGRLEAVPLRTAWPDEAQNFTPWLAEDANLALLGEALGLQLELEAVEKAVGPFSADILAKEAGSERWVLIENQIAPTDHKHLGQLLTYAAGLDAKIVVWIAENFHEKHRAALDFLNRATREDYAFFAVTIELFKIGESSLAPSFSVVAKPNNWEKEAQAAKQVAQDSLSPAQAQNRQFWSGLIAGAASAYPALSARSPYKSSWQCAERLRSSQGFYAECNAAFTSTGQLRAEVYLGGPLAKSAFHALEAKKAVIEAQLGATLAWEELPKGQDSRIALYMPGVQKREDQAAWPLQHEWLLMHWKKLGDALRPYIADLNLQALAVDPEEVETG
jgi:Domain of unknown function (DUF4268)